MEGIRRWFRLRDVQRDVDEEIALYFDEMVRELERAGMSATQAQEEARRRFGDERHYRSELLSIDRSAESRLRWRARWESARDVVKHAGRSVVRTPGLALGIVLAFALGIGANATMYATVERLLLKPPPHIAAPEGVRRVVVHRSWLGSAVYSASLAYPDYVDLTGAAGFAQVAAYWNYEVTAGSGEGAEQLRAVFATPNYFALLGVRPALGRFYTDAEDARGAPGRVVISYGYWRRRFGGSASALGQSVDFGYGPYTVVGVTPRGFTGIDLSAVDFFAPFHTAGAHTQGEGWEDSRGWYWLSAVARLAPGVSVERAEAEATALHRAGRAESSAAEESYYDPNARIVAAPLLVAQGPNAPSEVAVARWLLGVAGIVLLIACLNVANLLLARMIRQRRETAIRLALGISRRRLVAQIVTEGMILGLVGGAAALLLTWWGGTLVQQTLLPDVDWSGGPSRTLLYLVSALSLCAGALSALVPAYQAARRQVMENLRVAGGGLSRATIRLRGGLSMLQAALSVVLLVGAGLFVRSLDRIRTADHGLDLWGVAHVVPVFHQGSVQDEDRWQFYERAVTAVQRVPGVTAVASTFSVPFWSAFAYDLRVPGLDSIPMTSAGGPYGNVVHNDYFRTLDVDLRAGRLFDERDTRTSKRVVIVNQSFARALWPDGSALGKCIFIGENDPPCFDVVGVVEDAKRGNLIEEVTYQYYMPMEQRSVRGLPRALLMRVDGGADVLPGVQRALLAVDSRVRYVRTRAMSDMVAQELRQWRLGAVLFSLFGALALLVAAIGLYSVLAFDVAQRVREIGLRTALGASTAAIINLVVSRAVRITAAGVVIGGALAVALAPRLQGMLYGVTPRDPLTFLLVAVSLGVVSLVASGVPAWRAARVDPNVALRSE